MPAERATWSRHRIQAVSWLAFYGLVLLAWAVLWVMAQDGAALSGVYGLELLAALCGTAAGNAGLGALTAMWAVMAAAMMAPTAVPALRTYLDLGQAGVGGFWLVLGGYLAVWALAAVGFAAAQAGLGGLDLVGPDGASRSLWLTAILMAGAGAYQFSPLKSACLTACRRPLMFFMQHWRPGRIGAVGMGLRLGLTCLGCCWALMALAFVGGMTSLAWMGVATMLMVMEKLPEIGRVVTRPLGVGLILAAAVIAVRAAFV